jgi:GNAT superfamily N-acetyltransferase
LAILPDFENRGIGRELLDRTSRELASQGHTRLFLGCSTDAASRSYGFYRHLGWRSTGSFDQYGDEILEIFVET